jgi:hypothetical protein
MQMSPRSPRLRRYAAAALATVAAVAGTVAATVPAEAAPACGTQWRAEYFPNTTLTGNAGGVRCEAAVDHVWGTKAPGVGTIPADKFSARWTLTKTFAAGSYTFTTQSDDGVRVFLDAGTSREKLVLSNWKPHGLTTNTADVAVAAGTHTVTVEYYDWSGSATIKASIAGAGPAPSPAPANPGVPARAAGHWYADQAGVPTGSLGCDSNSGTPAAKALATQWDYWDRCGGSAVSAAAEGLPATPWKGDRVVKWHKPAGDSNVYQKLNRTLNKDNFPRGTGKNTDAGSPADASGRYIAYQYIPSKRFTLNPGHGWVILSEFKENYRDSAGNWQQDSTWGVACNNFSGTTRCAFSPHKSKTFALSDFTDRWVKWEYRVYQGAKDKTGHGGRIELYADDKLVDTGYESEKHVGSAAFGPLGRTLGWVWIVGQYTSNQDTNGVPDYRKTDVTSYVGLSAILPLP